MALLSSLVATLLLSTPQAGQSSTDFSAIDALWPVVRELKKDVEPSDEAWKKVFDTPAYKYLRRDEFAKRFLRLTLMPSKKSELQDGEAKGGSFKEVVKHFRRFTESEEKFKQMGKDFAGRDLVKESLHLTKEFLPSTIDYSIQRPKVCFALFGLDGYAGDEIVVVDIVYVSLIGDGLKKFLGHEAHHLYIGQLSKLKAGQEKATEFQLLRAFRQMQVEGVADLVDKTYPLPPEMEEMKAYAERYNKEYENLASTLAKIDSLVVEIANDNSKLARNIGEVWKLLPFGAHPAGFAMTNMILKQLGKQALMDSLGNPFEFVRLYNKAAGKTPGAHVFSVEAMAFLGKMETQFVEAKN